MDSKKKCSETTEGFEFFQSFCSGLTRNLKKLRIEIVIIKYVG